jgi:hypothetical protein
MTQESKGAKFKGAAADVADKIVKRLFWDIDKFQKLAKYLILISEGLRVPRHSAGFTTYH